LPSSSGREKSTLCRRRATGEAFHIKEWLAFHRLAGAARFWLACNDPDPQPLLQLLDAHIQPGLVAVRHVPS